MLDGWGKVGEKAHKLRNSAFWKRVATCSDVDEQFSECESVERRKLSTYASCGYLFWNILLWIVGYCGRRRYIANLGERSVALETRAGKDPTGIAITSISNYSWICFNQNWILQIRAWIRFLVLVGTHLSSFLLLHLQPIQIRSYGQCQFRDNVFQLNKVRKHVCGWVNGTLSSVHHKGCWKPTLTYAISFTYVRVKSYV